MKFIITESQYKILLENIPVIDDILDKMSKVGYENLTSQEKSTLNKYSEHLKSGQRGEFVPDEPNDNQEIDDKSGETWETELADKSIFSFQFDYDEEDMGVKMLFGTVMWDNREWIGCIVVDEDKTLGMLDFVEDTGDFLTYDANDPSSKPQGDEEAFLTDELGQLIDEVEYFVEEKIIPDLI